MPQENSGSGASDLSGLLSYAKYAAIIAIFLFIFYFFLTHQEILTQLATGYGLFGLFVAAIIANATVLLPLPIDIVFLVLASQASSLPHALTIAVVLGAGAGIGEMSAYFAGRLGAKAAEQAKRAELEKVKVIGEKIGELGMYFIYFSALVPFPFDIIGITAGLIKYDPKKFFVAALAGKTTRYVIIAVASYYGFTAVKSFFHIG